MTGLETPTWVKYAGDLAFLVIFLVTVHVVEV